MTLNDLVLKDASDLTPLERNVRSIIELVELKVKGQRVSIEVAEVILDEDKEQATLIIRTDAAYSTISQRFQRAGAYVIRTGYILGEFGSYEIVLMPAQVSA